MAFSSKYFFLLCQLNTITNSNPNAMSQNRPHNVSMQMYLCCVILQISVQSGTRAASTHMSRKWMGVDFNQFNNCDMKEPQNM